jgi:DNA (cytosine-5)-methyltransferase 1
MNKKLRALDLFCGGGGAGMGLRQAGFEVVGVDFSWHFCYPFQQLWLDALKVSIDGYDFLWASPPCQGHSTLRHLPGIRDIEYPNLIVPTRERLLASGLPFVIENVVGAPLRQDLMLCGTMFGLQTADGSAELRRHRIFEIHGFNPPPQPTCLHGRCPSVIGVYGCAGYNRKGQRTGEWAIHPDYKADARFTHQQCKEAMGVDWMVPAPLSQSIPPAYSRFIVEHFIHERSEDTRSSAALQETGNWELAS